MSEPTEPIEYFLEDMAYHGRSERTRDAYERVLESFDAFLEDPARNPRGEAISLESATHRDCLAWIHDRRDELAESTIASYASYLHRFYSYMTQVGEFEDNPMTLVMEELDERIATDPSRRDISVKEMRAFVDEIHHPLDRAIVTTLLKTGIRAGELCNLDLQDLNLESLPFEMGTIRPQLEGRPDSIFVSSEPSSGNVINGEERSESNKRMRDTVLPVDDELKTVLVEWLAIRPDPVSATEPLFLSTDRHWGERITGTEVHHIVTSHAADRGWYRRGAGASENVTPHYFRHFFTTHLRDRTGDRGIVKYLRGDAATDIIDTYTHNWGDRVRSVYESNIYSLFDPNDRSISDV
ncbi:MAG: tyrosine-type recombinase/integrase [Halodesulfurarchaeum sp.]